MAEGKTPAASAGPRGLPATLRSPMLLLGLLAAQFALAQLLTGVQFGDAPRNMHWGLLTFEHPAFLIGDVDTFERIKGFPPDPESLGPNRLWGYPYGSFHPWWGPVTPLIFAAVWGATRSYTLLQLVVPLAGGATVLLTYAIARDLLDRRRALIAAAFLSCYPIFREYSSVSYTETLSALWLTAAFLCYMRGRTALTVLFGALAALSKMDMLALYGGVIAACAAWDVLRRERRHPLAHHSAALIIPLLIAAPWVWFHTLDAGQRGP
ncbi:MAG: glycosyltransferase family 39 protein, partial [Chloroflexales bacterium]